MKAYSRNILDLFESKTRYVMPLYQRPYVWNEEDHWSPLWDDIHRKVEQRLTRQLPTSHFLGAIVIEQKKHFANEMPSQLVVDGQQRLTTIQIFMLALRDVCADRNFDEYSSECSTFLLNTGLMPNREVEQFKIYPTNSDRQIYFDLIQCRTRAAVDARWPLIRQKRKRRPDRRHRFVECYLFFYDRLTELLTNKEIAESDKQILEVLLSVLRADLQVVTVELEEQDDPQAIFEALNARGEPLLPSDLMRNFVFMRAAMQKLNIDALYEKYWRPIETDFWKSMDRQGRISRPRSDFFMQHYLGLKTGREIQAANLYSEYREWSLSERDFSTVEHELAEMTRFREVYAVILDARDTSAVGRFGIFLRAFDTSTVLPTAMTICADVSDESVRNLMLQYLESFIWRRAICGMSNKNYNRRFISLLKGRDLRSSSAEAFAEILDGTVSNGEFPTDAMLLHSWRSLHAYSELGPNRVAYTLHQLEIQARTNRAEDVRIMSPLTIEHVMPRNWIEHWLLPSGKKGWLYWSSPSEASENDRNDNARRNRLVESFGNLTLISHQLNSSISNGPYADKRRAILDNSLLTLNKYFMDVIEWNEDAIEKRSAALFELALKRWPRPAIQRQQ